MHYRKRTRLSLLLVTVVLIASMLASCGAAPVTESASAAPASSEAASVEPSTAASESASAEESPTQQEFVTLQIIYPGDMSKRMESFLSNEFATKMKDELSLAVELSWIPWDQYWGKKDVMIAAGEQIDWYWDGGPNFSQVITKSASTDIDELLQKNGTDILRMIPKENFDPFRKEGKIHAIPIQAAPTAEKFKSTLARTDFMEEAGISDIKSVADLETYYTAVVAKHPEMKFSAGIPSMQREYIPFNSTTYGVGGSILLNEDTGKAEAYFLNPAYEAMCRKVAEWNAKGWIGEDLTLKAQEDLGRFATGLYLFNSGAISRPMENINDVRKNAPEATLNEYLLSPEKPKYKWLSSTEIIVISPTAKYPDRAMQMINWFLASKENYMFAIYGVEGQDYKMEGDRISQLTTDSLWYEWMFRNREYVQFPTTVTDDFIKVYKAWDEGAVLSKAFGFTFDTAASADQEAQLKAVLDESFLALTTAYVDFDKNYPKAVEDLKAAGMETYVAEFQKQLDAYLAK